MAMKEIKSHIIAISGYTIFGCIVGVIIGLILGMSVFKSALIALSVVVSMHFLNYIVALITYRIPNNAAKKV